RSHFALFFKREWLRVFCECIGSREHSMGRSYRTESAPHSDGSPPSEAWLFAQAILGKPIPRIASPEMKARAKREELERISQFSSRGAEELRRLNAAEAVARHDREVLKWAAGISSRAAEKLRALE